MLTEWMRKQTWEVQHSARRAEEELNWNRFTLPQCWHLKGTMDNGKIKRELAPLKEKQISPT